MSTVFYNVPNQLALWNVELAKRNERGNGIICSTISDPKGKTLQMMRMVK